ncbi:predicted GPI-anchored protein 58 isoform X3 [Mauremys reevesii]|uniref:predicted GPI-anchored protein 58 isoform X3 n=1 Tax=Mauremys reevesii TaxID=260615 RepID=UPI00193EE468|nr:predicted GPI-anchored protein 58 isoform X3 [Mauremys reevesii]
MCRSRQNTKHQRVDPCLPFLITQSILRDLNPGPFGVPAPSWDSTSPGTPPGRKTARSATSITDTAAVMPAAACTWAAESNPQTMASHQLSAPGRPATSQAACGTRGRRPGPTTPREPDFPVPASEDPSLPRSLALLPTAPVLGRAVDPRGFPAAAPLRNIPALPEQGVAPQNTQSGFKWLFCRKTSSPGISWLLGIVGLCSP